jgi:ribosomal protein S18 acetylase RimI-like enzyme
VTAEAIVAIRPLRRGDVAAFATWGRHDDPLFAHYNVRALSAAEADGLWRALAGEPHLRRAYAALAGDDVVGSLVVRLAGTETGDVGIVLDPRRIGRGLGRRILAAFVVVLAGEGFRRLQLDVAGYNARAIAAYRATGFAAVAERWDEPEPGIDVEALLRGPSATALAPHVTLGADGRYRMRVVRMERRLDAPLKVES